ncbi:hydrolase 2, exosortase A system-associated [Aquabacterium sp.]|uniref:hydrolase 2, exosortase A system-associated n=1 Tax=Aquabacterium sp. TaxID=1872578 RepID=UPI002CAB5F23|nr:hydrolase 2, exosortase A system-associated [Aquabacterium sp.]HSW06815.1 hydrolase 2, exosortase A system-associated [Aquabacterium sp.]
MAGGIDAFYLAADQQRGGQRLCLYHPGRAGVPRGAVVYVHPFAEEMNKSRRMAAQQARALAEAGFAVLQIDLLGCGDSSGDFGDATWDDWVADVEHASRWLRQRCDAPLWLWGLRAGALVAAAAAQRMDEPCHFLFWQPTPVGAVVLQQFLRLKAAAGLADGGSKAVLNEVRGSLAHGRSVDIAGYALPAALARGLEAATLAPPRRPGRVVWLEVSNREDATLGPASVNAVERWRLAGCEVHAALVPGPAFWQTVEIEDAPALLTATTAQLASAAMPAVVAVDHQP